MILYRLKCVRHHEFEAWFRDSAAYDTQRKKRAIACPDCGSTRVSKSPMAPRLARQRGEAEPQPSAAADPRAVAARKALEALRAQVEANCDYVGERFAEEARKIHYGEVERRHIYGEASEEDARSLTAEGIEFQRIPWIRRGDA
ncbi:MAG TPA: DUF1178 family protein [Alphaproteobacteria bacterium]|nr:DUF1178 family protein [Alphaproteobacteria bacterium]